MFIEKESLRSYEKFLKICGPLAKIMVVFFKNVNKNKNFFASPWKKIRRQEKNCRHGIFSSPEQNIVASSFLCRIFVDMSPSPEMYAPRLHPLMEALYMWFQLNCSQHLRHLRNLLCKWIRRIEIFLETNEKS